MTTPGKHTTPGQVQAIVHLVSSSVEGLTPDNVEELILGELADSALFALRFRQNAARSLLLPRGQPGKRAPLWLQRLRGRDLLQVARRHPDFPAPVGGCEPPGPGSLLMLRGGCGPPGRSA